MHHSDALEYAAGDTTHRRTYALLDAITKYVQIAVIELEGRDDPQIIFETLNARGEPLLPSDLTRNFVFLEATQRGQNVERLYQDSWHHFDEYDGGDAKFWKEELMARVQYSIVST